MTNSGGLLHANSKDAKKNCSDVLENGDYQVNRMHMLIFTKIAQIVCLYWAIFLLGWLCGFLILYYCSIPVSLGTILKSANIFICHEKLQNHQFSKSSHNIQVWLSTMYARAHKFKHSRLFNAILIMSLWIRMLFRILLYIRPLKPFPLLKIS